MNSTRKQRRRQVFPPRTARATLEGLTEEKSLVKCSDPLVEAFKGVGYNILLWPRQDFGPLLLLRSDGRKVLRELNQMAIELPSAQEVELPVVRKGERIADVDLRRTRELRGKAAVDALTPLLTAIGTAPQVAGEYGGQDGTTIVLRKAEKDSVQVGDLAFYLQKGVLPRSELVRALAAKGELYAVTAVLRSSMLTTETSRQTAVRVQASAPAGGPVTVTGGAAIGGADRRLVTFQGPESLTFGFQAVQLLFAHDVWSLADATGRIAFAAPPKSPAEANLLIVDDDLVDLGHPAAQGVAP